jgi:hypothetical protein
MELSLNGGAVAKTQNLAMIFSLVKKMFVLANRQASAGTIEIISKELNDKGLTVEEVEHATGVISDSNDYPLNYGSIREIGLRYRVRKRREKEMEDRKKEQAQLFLLSEESVESGNEYIRRIAKQYYDEMEAKKMSEAGDGKK